MSKLSSLKANFYWNSYYIGVALYDKDEMLYFDCGLVRGSNVILSIDRYYYWEVKFVFRELRWRRVW